MKKIETIWQYLLDQAVEAGQYRHTQAKIADYFNYSLSTVNFGLEGLTQIGAIRKSGKFFVVSQPIKILYYWATHRRLDRDIRYSTSSDLSINELVGLTPPEAVFGTYQAAKYHLGEPPADYNQLHLYLPETSLEVAKTRYPKTNKKMRQVVVLKMPKIFKLKDHFTSLSQTFVDIWNLPDWYAHDFTRSLEEKINGLLS